MVLVLIIVVSYVLTKFVERANVEIQGEGYYVEHQAHYSNLRREVQYLVRWAARQTAEIIEMRHQIHEFPELGNREFETSALVARSDLSESSDGAVPTTRRTGETSRRTSPSSTSRR